ncbi:MAG: type II toxin-antitoxin system VapB family antitoxin [Acidobacteria bacterium]|nr:type II toxin-antitoxin system VapB family antitoxin [Acidobacteriota bacterium]
MTYTGHMKRTNLVLDAQLLEEATRLLGAKTYSAAVNRALAELLRVRKIQSLAGHFGKGLWKGSLAAMREDSVRRRGRTASRRRGRT